MDELVYPERLVRQLIKNRSLGDVGETIDA